VFFAESGELLTQASPLQPHELLYRAAEADGARDMGANFLAQHCGILCLSRQAIEQVRPLVPTDRDWIRAQEQHGVLTVAPLYRIDQMVGLQCRIVPSKSIASPNRQFKTLGQSGIYIANPYIQPFVVIVYEGIWDAVTAAWDAFQAGEPHRYAFAGITANTGADELKQTLDSFFPGTPVLIFTDQDKAGIAARKKLARVGTLAILRGLGKTKDFRDADPKKRWSAVLEAVEVAINVPPVTQETGLAKIARIALDGSVRALNAGSTPFEAWRFGQRCAGICLGRRPQKSSFSFRVRNKGGTPEAEGIHDFCSIIGHPSMREIRQIYHDLAMVIDGGVTEAIHSQSWNPPEFLADGRHWTEVPAIDRAAIAQSNGWENWTGRDPGPPNESDLSEVLEHMRQAFSASVLPAAPSAPLEIYLAIVLFAIAMAAYWAEDRWLSERPTGFLPGGWIWGGPQSGKGSASILVSLATTGRMDTRGGQRFDGSAAAWLTESVFHGLVAFRDEVELRFGDSDREDLKTFLAGFALEVRKKFFPAVTVRPRPVLITSNQMTLGSTDMALAERILSVNLEPKPAFSRMKRREIFQAFYDWLENESGADCVHRLGIALYREYRTLVQKGPRWTRSSAFDTAVTFLASKFGADADLVMESLDQGPVDSISHHPWFEALLDYSLQISESTMSIEIPALEALGLGSSDSEQKKLRRWLASIQTEFLKGPLHIGAWLVALGPERPAPSRMLAFCRENVDIQVSSLIEPGQSDIAS
jgi:hypothetical protein